MNRMIDEEFELALKQMPCPACGEIGHLVTQQMEFKLNYKASCHGCRPCGTGSLGR